jgi:hypothetical protein
MSNDSITLINTIINIVHRPIAKIKKQKSGTSIHTHSLYQYIVNILT